MTERQNPPSATNAERAESNSALSLSHSRRRTARFDSRRVRAHRAVVRELDEWFGIFAYPDPAILYAIAPSREAAPNE